MLRSTLPVLLLTATLPSSTMAATCLSQLQLAGVIFGSVGATLAICIAAATVLSMWFRRSEQNGKFSGKSATRNDCEDIESKIYDDIPAKVSNNSQTCEIGTLKWPPRELLDTGTQKSFSVDNLREANSNVGVLLRCQNSAGFGMNIQGNMHEGIFVKTIVPMGPADQTGNILPGDRIKSLTISFDHMVYEDALTLLSYASPYKVKFELERKVETPPPMDSEMDAVNARIHPLFRSNTLTHIQFNTVGAPLSSFERASVTDTVNTKVEKGFARAEDSHTLKITEQRDDAKEDGVRNSFATDVVGSVVSSEVADSTTIDTDMSKMESSDYASDNNSEYRESESECGNTTNHTRIEEVTLQVPIIECTEVTDVGLDVLLTPTKYSPPRLELCKALPSKAKTDVLRSPPAKLASSCKVDPPPPLLKTGIWKKREKRSEEAPPPTAPPVPPLPPLKPLKPSIPSDIEAPMSPRVSESPTGAPEITEARVSRIPRRKESLQTPIIERKLPPLPKSVTQRSASEDKDHGDVWSRLYMEKRSMLRKPRDIPPTTRPCAVVNGTRSAITSPTPPKSHLRPPTDYRFGALDHKRRERLAVSQTMLDRDTDESREFGVM